MEKLIPGDLDRVGVGFALNAERLAWERRDKVVLEANRLIEKAKAMVDPVQSEAELMTKSLVGYLVMLVPNAKPGTRQASLVEGEVVITYELKPKVEVEEPKPEEPANEEAKAEAEPANKNGEVEVDPAEAPATESPPPAAPETPPEATDVKCPHCTDGVRHPDTCPATCAICEGTGLVPENLYELEEAA